MNPYIALLAVLALSAIGCGSTADEDASIRATVEAQQLEDQLQALSRQQTQQL